MIVLHGYDYGLESPSENVQNVSVKWCHKRPLYRRHDVKTADNNYIFNSQLYKKSRIKYVQLIKFLGDLKLVACRVVP